MTGSSLVFPARKHLSFCLGSFILSFCSQYWSPLTAGQIRFDTLFLQSSHKASPFLHRLQIKIHANTWRQNLGTVDRYYNHQLNNDAFSPSRKTLHRKNASTHQILFKTLNRICHKRVFFWINYIVLTALALDSLSMLQALQHGARNF